MSGTSGKIGAKPEIEITDLQHHNNTASQEEKNGPIHESGSKRKKNLPLEMRVLP